MASKLKAVAQIGFFIILAFVMNKLTYMLHIHIPGGILGMILVFILLQTKILRLEWVESGAKWFLAELLLFFVPSAVGMISYEKLLLNDGFQILLVVIAGTMIVMVCSGLIAQSIAKRKGRARV